ncbi:protein CNPPD1-like [Haliotis asinina]|uniref:protein CNPPD1-like n=1 Tax=Haliotis asinina TaxID=109174 RepID=UPI0035321A75
MFSRWSPGLRSDQARSRKRLEDEGLHEQLEERFRKTLYYGELPDDDDCPSLPLTNLAVEYFQDATPRGLGQANMVSASTLASDACVSPGSLVTSMIYASRLRQRNPDYLQKMSSSDLFFISVMMASKYMYDEGVDEEVFNDEWAEAANMELDEVNQMEREFLSAMDWQLFVSQSEFLRSVQDIERRIAWTQGCDRGWLSYTDFDVLFHDKLTKHLWDCIAKEWLLVITVSSAAYVASFLTMVGSTALAIQLSTSMTGYAILRPPVIDQPHTDRPPVGPAENMFGKLESAEPSLEVSHILSEGLDASFELRSNFSQPPRNESGEDRETGGHNLLEKVLPQLWAVVAFKDRFVQLMCAFSAGLKQRGSETLRKIPRKCVSSRGNKHRLNADNVASPTVNFNEMERLQMPPKLKHQCHVCPHCHGNDQSPNKQFCPVAHLSNEDDASAMDLTRLKSNLDIEPWCCYGNRPPDGSDVNLEILQYPDIMRGFSTGVPIAA